MKYRKTKLTPIDPYVPGMEDGLENGKPYLNTLEGKLFIPENGWIATGEKGERWAIQDDIFKNTYEPVGENEIKLRIFLHDNSKLLKQLFTLFGFFVIGVYYSNILLTEGINMVIDSGVPEAEIQAIVGIIASIVGGTCLLWSIARPAKTLYQLMFPSN
jgi:hypothetical protein